MSRSPGLRALSGLGLVAALSLCAAGIASAQPSSETVEQGVPTACDPEILQGEVAPVRTDDGYRHYRLTLFPGPGAAPCAIAGSPVDVVFDRAGTPLAVRPGTHGEQTRVVRISQGSPAHVDVRVPVAAAPTPADGITFTLRAPDGTAAAAPSHVASSFEVAPGTTLGPVRPGV